MLAYEKLVLFFPSIFWKSQLKYITYATWGCFSTAERRNRNTLLLAIEIIQTTISTAHLPRFPKKSLSRIIILNYKKDPGRDHELATKEHMPMVKAQWENIWLYKNPLASLKTRLYDHLDSITHFSQTIKYFEKLWNKKHCELLLRMYTLIYKNADKWQTKKYRRGEPRKYKTYSYVYHQL